MASHAFAPPSVGLWVVNPDNLADRLPKIARLWDGLISDVFVPGSATRAQADAIRATPRVGRPGNLRAQLWAAANHAPNVAAYAERVVADSKRLAAGVADLNIEVADAGLADYCREAVQLIRRERPTFKLRVDIAPYKGFGLSGLAFVGDPHLYACEQAYYGDMSPVTPDEALGNLLDFGVPRDRASVCYGAAAPIGWTDPGIGWDPSRHFSIGTLYSAGFLNRALKHGLIFQDDLLVETGRL